MSKHDYINACNEIKPDEKLKNETLSKMKNTSTKRVYNKVYPLASLAIMCAIVLSIVIPNKNIEPIKEEEYAQVEQESTLQKVETFDNLYAMLRKRAKKNEYNYLEGDIIESVTDSLTTNSAEKSESADSSAQEDFSETNVQVEGVDEADIVKTDGKYIYYLSNDNLVIVDASNDTNMKIISKIEFDKTDFYPSEIFLKDNMVIVIGTESFYKDDVSKNEEVSYSRYQQYTTARVYNIENKEKPTLERTVEIEGDYLSSRMIGNNLYLISNKYLYSYLCREYKISELDEEEFKTEYLDTAVGEETKCISFENIFYFPEFEDTSYLNIVAFDITNNEPANINSYLGAGQDIYASNNNLYIARVKYDYKDNSSRYDLNTEIYKFKLEDTNCTFEKTGTVPGAILNQFSMDEKDGYFRIATTDSRNWNNEEDTNNLYVLNDKLEIVGKVEGLAKGEKIYSVRFMGNRAYMVTFVETDPLFVIDLSDPTNPTVLGELKIPGYSKYLHPYDETHLIGFEEDTKVVNYGYGDIVTTDGMKMSLFDVTDSSNPKEMYTVKIGEKGTYSELLYNHKSLLFSKEKNIIAFPISITEEDYKVTFQGAIVYGLSLENGFELKGRISNTENELDKYYSRNNVKRIIYIKDTLYTLSDELIKAVDMNTMETKSSVGL